MLSTIVVNPPLEILSPDDEQMRRAVRAETIISEGLERLELECCAADPVHFLNEWGYTYNPKLGEGERELPFTLFQRDDDQPDQVKLIRWIQDRERKRQRGLVEKSRDWGVTWLCCGYAVHGLLFRQGFACGFGSLKSEEVDKLGDMNTILEKCRYLLRRLPTWMLPPGWKEGVHAGFRRIVNRAKGSHIIGESGDDMGRGGRSSIFFLDEAARVARPELVDAALFQNTNCRIDVSTPKGVGNSFYKARHTLPAEQVFTCHWTTDPRKNREWYDRQVAEMNDPALVAQELDIDYSASVAGVTIPAAWVRAAVDFLKDREDWLEHPKEAGLDVGEEHDLCVFLTRQGPLVCEVESWTNCTPTQSAWRARDLAVDHGVTVLRFDSGGIGSGVRGTFQASDFKLPFEDVPVMFGWKPTSTVWPDKQRSYDKFENLRAEMWWTARCRFQRTYEKVAKGIDHPDEECIGIPQHPQLMAELSMPLYEHTSKGKVKIQSKDDMPKSPDFADALVLAFAPVMKRKMWIA